MLVFAISLLGAPATAGADTTAPVVQVDTVSDSLVGPSDPGTDVTWHADEDGTYSVRVGGADCTTGTEVAGGIYIGAPAQLTTSVSAGQLAEGSNTIRVCVTDVATNKGSTTTSVVKDTTAPTVVIDTLSDSLVGPSDPDTAVTWHADEPGTYSVRVYGVGFPGASCLTGTELETGSYGGAPGQITTTVSANSLPETLVAILICIVDPAGNQRSETAYVVKDLTAPAVAIDSVSPDPVGASGSTTVTWRANEAGTYGVRLGGSSCTTGTQVAAGDYDTPSRQHATTVNAAALAEGANQIRVCVADLFGNQAASTTSVAKDTAAPTVTIDNVTDTLIGPADPGTEITWHASENGSYSVRVGGTSCTTGTEVAGGSYGGAPAQHNTSISADQLAEGTNTIRVCLSDAAGNQDDETTSVVKDTSQVTTLTFGAEADARVEEGNPDANFGSSSTLFVEGGSALDRHSYLRFQLTGLAGTVTEAKLRLWVTNATANGPAVHATDWAGAENALTWNNRPAPSSGPHDDKQALVAGAWVEYDVTPLVSGNGTEGFVLIGTSSDSLGVSSREASTASQRPELVVTAVTQGSDLEPPSAPTGLTATAAGPTQVDLDWEAATDNVAVTGYEIYRDESLLTTVGNVTNYQDTTVVAATDYEYVVRALDGAGNVSDQSNEATVTTPSPGPDPIIMAAGDQACDPTHSSFNNGLGTSTSCRQKYTSDLLVNQGLTAVLVLGDIQYECGGFAAFQQSYDPSWGRVKSISYPVPGNHEYHTTGGLDCDATGSAAGYFNYFGAAAGDPAKGYYSFDLGAWHVIALNSNCSIVSCSASSAQASWLQADLAANPETCTLAFWHHPKFTSGTNSPGSNSVKPLFQILYDHEVDVGLVGHDHDYERFALKNPDGVVEPSRGIRQFVVGTGGRSFHNWGTIQPGSEARQNDTFGVLKMTLRPDSYEWQFVPEAGKTYTDTGSTPCVD
jgi:hypothetical protein